MNILFKMMKIRRKAVSDSGLLAGDRSQTHEAVTSQGYHGRNCHTSSKYSTNIQKSIQSITHKQRKSMADYSNIRDSRKDQSSSGQ